jgi:hypothetical protein
MEQVVVDVSAEIGERASCKPCGVYRDSLQRRCAARTVKAVIAAIGGASSMTSQQIFPKERRDKFGASSSARPGHKCCPRIY